MTLKNSWFIGFLFFSFFASSQNFSGVYKIADLLKRTSNKDTTYIVNFWATWCKPCIEELPSFDSLLALKSNLPVKILLVSLDFKEDLHKKVKPFLSKHQVKSECLLLDESNGNEFIDKVSPSWSGAIPATLFKHGEETLFVEKKMKLAELIKHTESLK